MSAKWKVTIQQTESRKYCQRALISNSTLPPFVFEINWTMGYGSTQAGKEFEKKRKKQCIALAREVCAFLNEKGDKP